MTQLVCVARGACIRAVARDFSLPGPFDDPDARAVVLLFTRTDCPISNRYAPEIRRVYSRYHDRGVSFYLVYPDRDETPETIEKHRAEYSYPMPGDSGPPRA